MFRDRHKDLFGILMIAGTVGLHMVSATLVGAVIGYFLDDWLGTGPYLFLILLICGIAAGFMMVYEDTQKLMREDKKRTEQAYSETDETDKRGDG
ncbi:MAG: AtpZ/AtpI family protein [Desulfovibrionaceae bacterium]